MAYRQKTERLYLCATRSGSPAGANGDIFQRLLSLAKVGCPFGYSFSSTPAVYAMHASDRRQDLEPPQPAEDLRAHGAGSPGHESRWMIGLAWSLLTHRPRREVARSWHVCSSSAPGPPTQRRDWGNSPQRSGASLHAEPWGQTFLKQASHAMGPRVPLLLPSSESAAAMAHHPDRRPRPSPRDRAIFPKNLETGPSLRADRLVRRSVSVP